MLEKNADPSKQQPIAWVNITLQNPANRGPARSPSNAAGFFALTLPPQIKRGQAVTLDFQHPGYQPLRSAQIVGDQLYIVHLTLVRRSLAATKGPVRSVGNILLRYSEKTITNISIGSAVRTFQAVNIGNVPCDHRPPCSPDGRWKAGVGSLSLDAGEDNVFQAPRVTCVAGPCAFTRVDSISQNGRHLSVSVRAWSDTATFLLEAEVFRSMPADIVRQSYPSIFGRVLNFSLPSGVEQTSLEAEIDGQAIVFPLGPNLCLSWANCSVSTDAQQAQAYRCELKPGYRFR